MNITDAITEHARNRPDHPAIEDGDRIISYRALDQLIDAAAANLRAAGIGAGDAVGILLKDSAEHAVALCAAARAGAVILSLSPSAPRPELEADLARLGAKAVISSGARSSGGGLVWLRRQDICTGQERSFAEARVGGDAPLLLIQSSGTTGAPKTFLRSHAELALWIERYRRGHGWTADERCLSLTGMSFNVGRNITFGMLHLGATVVVNHARDYGGLVDLVSNKRVSYLKLTPSHLVPLLDYAADKAPLFPGLRAMVVGSAPTTHAQRLLARQRLTANFFEQLGSNEAGLLAVARPAEQDAYPDAVGRVVDGVEAQIVDDEDRVLPAGTVGRVRFRGAGYPSRYLDDAAASARAFRDGWFYPGDLAALNEQGYLFFKGRADDVINNAGAKFYPIEVESVLLAHQLVQEAAVLAWPHARFGQVAVACVVADPALSADALQDFCRRNIAAYKVPVAIAFLAALPKNPMGKVVKGELHDTIKRLVANSQRAR